jgi:D-alanyl-D-alanine carboxypeptidase (penicillin-binding protein 5/6)
MIPVSWRLVAVVALVLTQTADPAWSAQQVRHVAAPRARASSRQPARRQTHGPVAALLMDVRTGRILYARNIHQRWYPASTTKMLTSILALERYPEDVVVTISPRAAAARQGSIIGLTAGEHWLLGDLIRAMLVHSANDAAVAVAEAVSGSVERFAAAMNLKARQIGARESHFTNPNGLPDPAHYSTAYDLALIARYALKNPQFAGIVRTESWEISRPGRTPQEYVNTNRLLRLYAGADGVKTGFTAASGHTLVASATRDGWQLVAVVLRDGEMYQDVEQLLDYGFKTFVPVVVAGGGHAMATVAVGRRRSPLVAVVPSDVVAVVRRGARVAPEVVLRPNLRLPIRPGTPVGQVRFVEGQSVVAQSILVAAHRVAR